MKFPAAGPQGAPSPRRRTLSDAIVRTTGRLVGLAERNAWEEVAATLAARRSLLGALEGHAAEGPMEADCIAAVRSAVLESDMVIAQLCPPRMTGQA